MRRSTAPSQFNKPKQIETNKRSCVKKPINEDDEITIERLPLFDFLSIPDPLKRQFNLPRGCVTTAETVALRKVKTLGLRKNFRVIRPGDLGMLPPRKLLPIEEFPSSSPVEEEEEEEDNSEYPPFEPLVLWSHPEDPSKKIEVIPQLACRLRPHQREGVQFLFECTMGLRGYEGEGCILADDMGLGKTLMSITLIWTLLNQGFEGTGPNSAVQKAMVVCPTSLVGNWENELKRWIGDNCPTFPVHSEPKKVIKQFVQHRGKGILIISYETQRRYSDMFHSNSKSPLSTNNGSVCQLLVCDEAHKLKNCESGLTKSLSMLPAKKRVLLSGTPMQNELSEFFNMVDFCNPNVLGSSSHFRRVYERPILLSREPDATDSQKSTASKLQKELSTIVNEFILKRGNILNAQHLPPKLVQYVCCKNTPLQNDLYDLVIKSKNLRHFRDGKQLNTLNSLRHLLQITSHPDLILSSYKQKSGDQRDEELEELANYIMNYYNSREKSSKKGSDNQNNGGNSSNISRGGMLTGSLSRSDRSLVRASNKSSGMKSGFDPELSGKFLVLFRLMYVLRQLPTKDRIVIISNSTQTLDLVETMCKDNNWPWLRLDGTTSATKRTKLVAEFNDLKNNSFAFLLSSKAGGCGINLIGGNRLVLFDPDWNPASDKQAAGRIWREGQQKRCYIYRFMGTCTIEEKIIQRQLSKEGLQNIVDDKDQVNQFSTNELKAIFTRRTDTRSDTHDTLRCKRCSNVKVLSSTGTESWQLMNPIRLAMCSEYLQKLRPKIEEVDQILAAASESDEKENLILEYDQVAKDLTEGKFPSLPLFSKKIRETIKMIDSTLNKTTGSSTLFSDFLDSWSALSQSMYSKENSNEESKEGEEDEDDEEFVEQEGCPDETDFNKWSHHCSPNTCDDEALKKAMNDDTSVSFVFGLEVNWSLLQAKVAQEMEAEERRKEQNRLDLLELNARRARERKKLAGEPVDENIGDQEYRPGDKDLNEEEEENDNNNDNDDDDEDNENNDDENNDNEDNNTGDNEDNDDDMEIVEEAEEKKVSSRSKNRKEDLKSAVSPESKRQNKRNRDSIAEPKLNDQKMTQPRKSRKDIEKEKKIEKNSPKGRQNQKKGKKTQIVDEFEDEDEAQGEGDEEEDDFITSKKQKKSETVVSSDESDGGGNYDENDDDDENEQKQKHQNRQKNQKVDKNNNGKNVNQKKNEIIIEDEDDNDGNDDNDESDEGKSQSTMNKKRVTFQESNKKEIEKLSQNSSHTLDSLHNLTSQQSQQNIIQIDENLSNSSQIDNWECSVCTFRNPENSLTCQMCRSRQSKVKKSDIILSATSQSLSSSQYSQNDGENGDLNGKKKSRGKLALPSKVKK